MKPAKKSGLNKAAETIGAALKPYIKSVKESIVKPLVNSAEITARKSVAHSSKIIREYKLLTPARIIILGFIALILTGGFLLSLPLSSKAGVSVSFVNALFTSASAVCVTGLVAADTYATWSVFGLIVILVLIQIGGLGFMSVVCIFFFIAHKKFNLSQRLLIVQSLSLKNISGVVRLVRHVLIGTFTVELIGALVLWTRFYPRYGLLKGLGMGIFHSISAFCNAGFDLMGAYGEFSSMASYAQDKVAASIVMLLVILGGIGFFVWNDIWEKRCFFKLHLHSKLVITVSLWLTGIGWVLFYIAERANPATIGNMSIPDALFASLFQSVMPRSGGFSIVNQASLTGLSKLMTIVLFFIGGSVGSAAGGIKNTTAAILFLSAVSSLRGSSRLSVFGRTISPRQILNAVAVLVIGMIACFCGCVAIMFLQPELPFTGVLFDVVSAFSNCGLTNGITREFSPPSLTVLMMLMFFGRAGIMTLGMAAVLNRNNSEKIKHPDEWVMMG